MRQIEERVQTEVGGANNGRGQGRNENLHRGFIPGREMVSQCAGEMLSALQDAQRFECVHRRTLERRAIELAVHQGDVVRQAGDRLGTEQLLE
ncbi:MAG TPA: hypothetical protein VEH04_20500 [Verrucomicrobiae bacterium]|nr:hypothetical protein [Verrucomicrobiae bacterium]